MSTETEVKIRIDDLDDFCSRLNTLGPRILSEKHFEDNFLLDFEDGSLKASRRLVRIRHARGVACLTFKGPPEPEGLFKTREELEIKLEDGEIALHIFERLGMRVWFRYQKYRREFALGEIHVAVDETPVGNYAEFEGSKEGIRALAREMGIEESQFLRQSYYSLYLEYCRATGDSPCDMIY